jgi:putative copper export protein
MPAIREVLPAACEWCVYLAVLAAGGGTLFLAFIHDRRRVEQARLARLVIVAAVIGGIATLALLPLPAFRIVGHPDALTDIGVLSGVLESGYGVSALVRLGGLFVLVLAVAGRRLGWPVASVAATAAVGAVWSFILMGHSATGQPRVAVAAATAAHLLATAAWLGGLVLLWRFLGLRDFGIPASARVVRRFSQVAGLAVFVFVVSGAVLVWAHGGSLAALTASEYGLALAGKTAIVAAVLLIGAYNRWRMVPAISAGDWTAWTRLRRTVGVEICGIALVLAVTAALINLPPPALHPA